MPAGIQQRRRIRDIGLGGLLVEREEEIRVLEQSVAAAQEGTGGIALIEGPAGIGKSRLITIAGDLARESGMQILGAHGAELEREFPFGVAMQLFEPRLRVASPAEWDELLAGPARLARGLLETGQIQSDVAPGAQEYALIHALFWLTCNFISASAEQLPESPLVVLVDDAHWADRSSLRFLQYLADRISDLPALLIMGLRPGETSSARRAVDALRTAAATTRLRPGSLTSDGIATLVHAELPDADEDFVAGCDRLTRGNPFLLVELLAHVRSDELPPNAQTARRLRGLAPDAIINVVVSRLGTMSNATRSLVLAVSVLGDGAALRHAARLAGLQISEAAVEADALAARSIFHAGEPLSFVHPLIRSAVIASTSPLALGHAHRRAAMILAAEGVSPDVIAAHLMAAPPEDDAHAVAILRAAASNALSRGAAASAARLLARALREPPQGEALAEVTGELANAEALAGQPCAIERLNEAIALTSAPERRAELGLRLGQALYTDGEYRAAATALSNALSNAEQLAPGLVRELDAAYIAAASLLPELSADLARRRDRLIERASGSLSHTERTALAHIATYEAVGGAERDRVRKLAQLAWGDGALIEPMAADGLGWEFVTAALLCTDELERHVEICDAALAVARDRNLPVLAATASHCRAWPLYKQGRIQEAMAVAETAIDPGAVGWSSRFRTREDVLACCHLERGELAEAGTLLRVIDEPKLSATLRRPFLLDLRARLALVQHRPEDALADATAAGRELHALSRDASPGVVAWRSTAALAHLAMGEAARAAELALEELERARRLGVTRVAIRDLRVLGLAAPGPDGIRRLQEAVRLGEQYPRRLEFVYALLDLGAALRRSNQRAAARDPLRMALQLAHRGGITGLIGRAETELAAAGARPRREMLSGVESLTPSERRVADLAAEGLTTRQIAEALFVTAKTVEFHLRHVYQKLDISSRSQLPGALSR